jgi:hypothetical protein
MEPIHHLEIKDKYDANVAELQRNYADMTLAIGEGRSNHIHLDYVMEEKNQQLYGFLTISRFICSTLRTDECGIIDAMTYLALSTDRFDKVLSSTILAVTNEKVDLWNERVHKSIYSKIPCLMIPMVIYNECFQQLS